MLLTKLLFWDASAVPFLNDGSSSMKCNFIGTNLLRSKSLTNNLKQQQQTVIDIRSA